MVSTDTASVAAVARVVSTVTSSSKIVSLGRIVVSSQKSLSSVVPGSTRRQCAETGIVAQYGMLGWSCQLHSIPARVCSPLLNSSPVAHEQQKPCMATNVRFCEPNSSISTLRRLQFALVWIVPSLCCPESHTVAIALVHKCNIVCTSSLMS